METITNHVPGPLVRKKLVDDGHKVQNLPSPSGSYPYRLSLDEVLTGAVPTTAMAFHMVGDTGGDGGAQFRNKLSAAMTRQFSESQLILPSFLYHLGDIVYLYGEEEHYNEQFFTPFKAYPAPIFAIAGNHDADVNPASLVPYQSLDAFTSVFCDTASRPVLPGLTDCRKSMIQPNVYWTLNCPLATIIGLYSNVPKHGMIDAAQRRWFVEELREADLYRPGKALIVCIHHAPYSSDLNHGSSLAMIEFLEGAFKESGVRPDIVFSGHVHNYQHFQKHYTDGTIVPFIVAGAGGYHELHAVSREVTADYTDTHDLLAGTELLKVCDERYGFIRVLIEKSSTGVKLTVEYYALDEQDIAIVWDRFSIAL